MKRNQLLTTLLVCVFLFGCFVTPAAALETTSNGIVMPLVSGQLDYSFPAKTISPIGDTVSLDKGETIAYNCTYTPKSASLDFGYIGPDGLFYSINCTSGRFSKSIKIDKVGQYTLAIRNNEDYAVTVTGTVRH